VDLCRGSAAISIACTQVLLLVIVTPPVLNIMCTYRVIEDNPLSTTLNSPSVWLQNTIINYHTLLRITDQHFARQISVPPSSCNIEDQWVWVHHRSGVRGASRISDKAPRLVHRLQRHQVGSVDSEVQSAC
jgi:hypothetical protein